MSDNNSAHGSLPLSSTKPLFPLANVHMSTVNKGEQFFPTSYYIVDLATGFNDMDHKSLQRCPRVMQQDAFESVFGVTYMRTTYQKTRWIYDDNPDLAAKMSSYGHTKRSTWVKFCKVVESRHATDASSENKSDLDMNSKKSDEEEDEASQLEVALDPHANFDEESSPNEDIDWSQHCNYCNEPLPLHLLQKLLDLQYQLDAQSTHDGANGRDLSTNPNHRFIWLFVEMVEYCQRHHFEWDSYPDAANNMTWFGAVPVNFDLLPTRLEALAS